MGYYLLTGASQRFKSASSCSPSGPNCLRLPFMSLSALCNDNRSCSADPFGVWGSGLCMFGGKILLVKHLKASVLKQHEVVIVSSSSSCQRRLTPFACIEPSSAITLPCPRPGDESKLNSARCSGSMQPRSSELSSPPRPRLVRDRPPLNKRQDAPASSRPRSLN